MKAVRLFNFNKNFLETLFGFIEIHSPFFQVNAPLKLILQRYVSKYALHNIKLLSENISGKISLFCYAPITALVSHFSVPPWLVNSLIFIKFQFNAPYTTKY